MSGANRKTPARWSPRRIMINPPMRAIQSSYLSRNCPKNEADAPRRIKIRLKK